MRSPPAPRAHPAPAPGLTLPTLERVPARLTTERDTSRSAELLLAFDHLGARPARVPHDAHPDTLLTTLLRERLLQQAWRLTGIGIDAHIVLDWGGIHDQQIPLALMLHARQAQTFHLDALLDPLAQRDPHHANSLLAHLERAPTLLLAYAPDTVMYLLANLRWGGSDDESEWLEELRLNYDLPENTSDDTMRDLIEREGLVTPAAARAALRYLSHEPALDLNEIAREHPSLRELTNTLREPPELPRWRERTLSDLNTLRDALDDVDTPSFACSFLTGGDNGAALAREMYEEHEQYTYETGSEPMPLACALLTSTSSEHLHAFLETLDAIAHLLAYETRILAALDHTLQHARHTGGA